MTENSVNTSVVVGIDGSKAALRAAIWAADEALDRDNTLRLLHVVDPRDSDQEAAMAEARHMLAKAAEAVASTVEQVKVETDIVHGNPAAQLVNASRTARIVCLGYKGGRHSAHRRHRGAIASEVAKIASCTAVVVRRRKQPPPYSHQWVIAVLDEKPQSHVVLQTAINEAMLRKAALLALTSWSTTERGRRDRRATDLRAKLESYLDDANSDDADLQVCSIPMPDHIFNVLEQSAPIDQLVVIGTGNPELTGEVFSRRAAKILRKSDCSLMIARDQKAG
jgi:nucleotide-binding universal stress UspA family protein